MRSLHIAVLDADVPIPAVYARRGLYSTQFRTLLRNAAARLSSGGDKIDITTTAYDAVGACYPSFECLSTSSSSSRDGSNYYGLGPIDGILITGSAASAYDTAGNPWIPGLQQYIQKVYTEYPALKFFGSCFGHQILAQALLGGDGVKVEACPVGYEVGISPIELNPGFKNIFPRLKPRKEEEGFKLQLIHGDRVVSTAGKEDTLPSGWMNVGHTDKCPIQGLYQSDRVLTYQGHFEFDVFVNSETCAEFGRRGGWNGEDIQRFVGLIERGRGAPGEDENGDDDDSKAAAEVVVQFFLGEDQQGVERKHGLVTPVGD